VCKVKLSKPLYEHSIIIRCCLLRAIQIIRDTFLGDFTHSYLFLNLKKRQKNHTLRTQNYNLNN